MKDWTSIAKAGGVEVPPPEMKRIAETLDKLEAAFRPLAGQLDVSLEPAATFQAEEGAGDDQGSC
jgi:hypothetical protein